MAVTAVVVTAGAATTVVVRAEAVRAVAVREVAVTAVEVTVGAVRGGEGGNTVKVPPKTSKSGLAPRPTELGTMRS